MAESMHVRLKPYNPKKGHVLQCYTVGSIRFFAGRGWYKVDADMAAYLEAVHQLSEDEDSPLAFDVCTEAEARAMDAREARAARQVLPAEEAMDVTRRRRMRVADVTRSRRGVVRAPPQHQDEAGPIESTHTADAQSEESDDQEHEQPEDAADPWAETAGLARDIEDEGTAEAFDDGLPADPEAPPGDEVAETAEAAEDSSNELTTEDLPEMHGRRHRRRKRR